MLFFLAPLDKVLPPRIGWAPLNIVISAGDTNVLANFPRLQLPVANYYFCGMSKNTRYSCFKTLKSLVSQQTNKLLASKLNRFHTNWLQACFRAPVKGGNKKLTSQRFPECSLIFDMPLFLVRDKL